MNRLSPFREFNKAKAAIKSKFRN